MSPLQITPRTPFPTQSPFRTGSLAVSDLHTLYFEQVGDPAGLPVVYLHGGPGGTTVPRYHTFFDPKRYCLTLFDQRGCGQSTPLAEPRENTTWDLVADMEKLRAHLKIDRWVVAGGSWGTTLGLAYAQSHPERVLGLLLRGVFLCRQEDIDCFYGPDWAARNFPEAYAAFIAPIPEEERHDIVGAYYRRLTSDALSDGARRTLFWSWMQYEARAAQLISDTPHMPRIITDDLALSLTRLEVTYFRHRAWLEENQLLNNIGRMRAIPGIIVHGRHDMVCSPKGAYDLHGAWPASTLHIVKSGTHSDAEPAIAAALTGAATALADTLSG